MRKLLLSFVTKFKNYIHSEQLFRLGSIGSNETTDNSLNFFQKYFIYLHTWMVQPSTYQSACPYLAVQACKTTINIQQMMRSTLNCNIPLNTQHKKMIKCPPCYNRAIVP